jgi:hypothetical protein
MVCQSSVIIIMVLILLHTKLHGMEESLELAVNQYGSDTVSQDTASKIKSKNSDTMFFQSNDAVNKKLPAQKKWENVVSAPIWVVFSPVIAFLEGIQYSTALFSANKIGINLYYILVSSDGTRKVYPFYSSRYGLGIQYSKKTLINTESQLSFRGSYGWYQRHSLIGQWDRIRIFSDDKQMFAGIHSGYVFFPDEAFYGIGNTTSKKDKTLYASREISFESSVEKGFGRSFKIFVLPSIGQFKVSNSYNDNNPSTLKKFTYRDVAGVGTESILAGMAVGVGYEKLDSLIRTTRGMIFSLQCGFVTELPWNNLTDTLSRSSFGLWRVGGNYTRYFPLPVGPGRVVTMRAVVDIRRNLKRKSIPFYLLSRLGGEKNLRGLSRWRYYDNDLLALSVQYKFPVWRFADQKAVLDGVVYIDEGQVAENIFTKGSIKGFHTGAGFGFNVSSATNSYVQLITGFSSDGFHLYLTLG